MTSGRHNIVPVAHRGGEPILHVDDDQYGVDPVGNPRTQGGHVILPSYTHRHGDCNL